MSSLTDRMESDVSQVFLRASDFAVEADYTFGAVSKRINVLFEENYQSSDAYGQVTNTGPAVIAALTDVLNDDDEIPDSSATFEIDGVTYHVTSAQRSGSECICPLSRDEAQLDA